MLLSNLKGNFRHPFSRICFDSVYYGWFFLPSYSHKMKSFFIIYLFLYSYHPCVILQYFFATLEIASVCSRFSKKSDIINIEQMGCGPSCIGNIAKNGINELNTVLSAFCMVHRMYFRWKHTHGRTLMDII